MLGLMYIVIIIYLAPSQVMIPQSVFCPSQNFLFAKINTYMNICVRVCVCVCIGILEKWKLLSASLFICQCIFIVVFLDIKNVTISHVVGKQKIIILFAT